MMNLKRDLATFTGTTVWYRHPMNRSKNYTEGVKFLAERAKAYWLIDDILFAYQTDPAINDLGFQVWKLTVKEDNSATLRLEDGDKKHVKSFEISYTDFPLKEITLWLTDNVLLLPSEY